MRYAFAPVCKTPEGVVLEVVNADSPEWGGDNGILVKIENGQIAGLSNVRGNHPLDFTLEEQANLLLVALDC